MKAATIKRERKIPNTKEFQSTPPVKAATFALMLDVAKHFISIHAAREGGDSPSNTTPSAYGIFQSTPPVKAATEAALAGGLGWEFQSTPPVKAATGSGTSSHANPAISIHAAREGGDGLRFAKPTTMCYFNPRRP